MFCSIDNLFFLHRARFSPTTSIGCDPSHRLFSRLASILDSILVLEALRGTDHVHLNGQ